MAGGKDLAETPLRVSGGANITIDIVLASDSGTLDGTVKDSHDKPESNVTVVAIPDADHRKLTARFRKTNTDQRGQFVMQAMAPGDYTIVAWEEIEEGAYYDPEVLKKDEGSGKQMHLTPQSHQSITLKAIPAQDEHQP